MNVSAITKYALFILAFVFSFSAFAEVHGVLRVVKGDVQIKSGQNGQTTKARLGQEIYPKDTIITGKDARAKVVMIDNNEINVSPDSNVEIQNYEYNPTENKKDVLLNVIYGKVRSKVEQKYDGKTSKFQIKTPSAVAGVRGTDFLTGYDPKTQNTSVVTFRGAVELGLPGANGQISNSVSVTPGKMAQASGGGAPSAPVAVPPQQLAKMDHESNAVTGGTSQDSRTPAQDNNKKDKGDKGSDKPADSSGGASGDSGKSSSGDKSSDNSGNSSGAAKTGGAAATATADGGGGNSGSASGGNSGSGSGPAANATADSSNSGGNSGSGSAAAGGSGDSRSPASTGSSAPAASAAAPPTAAGPPSTAAGPVGPAPAAGSMLQTGDLGPSASGPINIPKPPTPPPVSIIPPAATPPASTTCQFCNNNVIGNKGTGKLTVHVTP